MLKKAEGLMTISERISGWGFKMHEVMSGTHRFEPGEGPEGKLDFIFKVDWGPRRITSFLRKNSSDYLTNEMHGTVTVGGMAERIPLSGTLRLDYFGGHTIRYEFIFEHGGEAFRYVGEKVNIRWWNLPVSHTTCFGTVTRVGDGRLVSRSTTYFRLNTIPSFLSSFRLSQQRI
jgi:hypothetical protein